MKKLMSGMVMAMLPFLAVAVSDDLVYYSTLDSADAIEHPVVGAAGSCKDASFQTGKKGNALYVPAGTGCAKLPLPNGLPSDKGTIEFWAKINSSTMSFGDGGDPVFFTILPDDAEDSVYWHSTSTIMFNSNNGAGKSGLYCKLASVNRITSDRLDISEYSAILSSPSDWHHYTIVWNLQGIGGTADRVRLCIDNKVLYSWSDVRGEDDFVSQMVKSSTVWLPFPYDVSLGKTPYLIDEFKVWKTDTPSEDPDPSELPVVSNVTAKQHYPWCGKVDIGYTVAGKTEGLLVKISVKDCDNDIVYLAKTFDVEPTAAAGSHKVVWDATTDGVSKVSKNMVATVSLLVPAE